MNAPAWQRWAILAGAIVLIVGGGYWIVHTSSSRTEPPPSPVPPPSDDRTIADPRLAYSGPYLNIHPDVKYVGDAACVDCHFSKADTYREHPMGRSLFPISQAPALPPSDAVHRNPFRALGRQYRVERDGQRVWHHEAIVGADGKIVCENLMEIKYVIGSGTHGHSFLMERDGYVMQSPITWYTPKQIWDTSPGWTESTGRRPVESRCLHCHCNTVEPSPGSNNRYVEPVFRGHTIGCERCHGPGERHVALWTGGDEVKPGKDYTIVNPSDLPWKLREAVCQQCHLEGETRVVKRGRRLNDFRPGLPLEQFWAVAVHDEEDFKVVNHVEQMYRSRCFEKTPAEHKLGCVSCHDPHVKPKPAERIAYFRSACLKCHGDADSHVGRVKPCSEPIAPRQSKAQNSCMDCHMPKRGVSDIPHIAGTDHRVLRRPAPESPAKPAESAYRPGVLPLRLFHFESFAAMKGEDRRDLGVALSEVVNQNKLPLQYSLDALQLLDEALDKAPDDADAWLAKGIALVRSNRLRDAYAAFRRGLELDPNFEMCIVSAAHLAQRLELKDEAIEYWKRAIQRNPHHALYCGAMAVLLAGREQWRAGKEYADRWVELDPLNVESHRLRTLYFLRLGERDAARKEFAVIEGMQPANLAEMRSWWEQNSR